MTIGSWENLVTPPPADPVPLPANFHRPIGSAGIDGTHDFNNRSIYSSDTYAATNGAKSVKVQIADDGGGRYSATTSTSNSRMSARSTTSWPAASSRSMSAGSLPTGTTAARATALPAWTTSPSTASALASDFYRPAARRPTRRRWLPQRHLPRILGSVLGRQRSHAHLGSDHARRRQHRQQRDQAPCKPTAAAGSCI